jgi:hypothetical protein
MKLEVSGRVVGHSIFQPNPKDEPELELVRISMTVSPATENAEKHTKAVLVVDKAEAWRNLVLGRMVKITIEDSQQDLFLPPTTDDPAGPTITPKGTISTKDPETGAQLVADLGDPKATARVVGAVVRGRTRQRKGELAN